MNKKPSFLERLTGAMKEDEEEDKDIFEEKEAAVETPKIISKEEPQKTKPMLNNSLKPKPKKITLQSEDEELESWMPESEGQLTIDVYQTPQEIIIKSTIAGVKAEDLDITITNDMVTIKGKREKDEEIQTDDYYYQECYWGAFSRSVILPVDVEAERAEAGMKNGILTIRLPKVEKVKTRKIKVSTV